MRFRRFPRSYITFHYRVTPRRTDLAERKSALAAIGRQMGDYKCPKPIIAQEYFSRRVKFTYAWPLIDICKKIRGYSRPVYQFIDYRQSTYKEIPASSAIVR